MNFFADLLHFSADTFGISSMIREAAKNKSCPTILEPRAIVTQDPQGNRNISPFFFCSLFLSIDPWGRAKRAMNHSDDSYLKNTLDVLALKSTIYWWNNQTSCNVILLLSTQLTLHQLIWTIHTKVLPHAHSHPIVHILFHSIHCFNVCKLFFVCVRFAIFGEHWAFWCGRE